MAARCARHGLATAPDGTCVRCRREAEAMLNAAAQEADDTSRRQAALGAFALVVVVAVIAGVFLWKRYERRAAAPIAASVTVANSAAPAESVDASLAPLVSVPLPPDPSPPGATASAREDLLQSAMHRVPIVLYGTQDSADCKRARTWLLANGYAFTDRDVANDGAAERARNALTGARTVPVLDIAGQALVGFDPDRVTRALAYAAARSVQRGARP